MLQEKEDADGKPSRNIRQEYSEQALYRQLCHFRHVAAYLSCTIPFSNDISLFIYFIFEENCFFVCKEPITKSQSRVEM